jgi:hypothetical protein
MFHAGDDEAFVDGGHSVHSFSLWKKVFIREFNCDAALYLAKLTFNQLAIIFVVNFSLAYPSYLMTVPI